ncbi:protein ORF85 [Cyprinid herpesvirus 3]|uniref:ORF85L n=1 Tax=Cyprinid herpesvirus 3 TaxID=180230 RepID=A3QMQ3_CYHV3|nr:unnamed protein product [Cyprinid herpesvirus 3]ABC55160.1 hypothetical protein [Cyprinid herpesvirus 3]ABG42912.1 protein ORF85 [Cyprinid herpesvirus 3]AIC32440.1 ORF85L [Cyprinid herpesvirus 3]AJP55573.1 protein ORF85 [Cyprinid herpesvirus 3]AJP55728.1 protein ORF85 [Cyprinid herpesvirus 3]
MDPAGTTENAAQRAALDSVDTICELLSGEFGAPVVINGFPYSFVQCYGSVHVVDLEGPDELTVETQRVLLITVSQYAHWARAFDLEMARIKQECAVNKKTLMCLLMLARQRRFTDDTSLLRYFIALVGAEMAQKVVVKPPEVKMESTQSHGKRGSQLMMAALEAWRSYGQLLFAEAVFGAYQRYLTTIGAEEYKDITCGIIAGLGALGDQQQALLQFTLMRRQVEAWKTYALNSFKVCVGAYLTEDRTDAKLNLVYETVFGQDPPENLTVDTVLDWAQNIRPATDTVGMFFVMALKSKQEEEKARREELGLETAETESAAQRPGPEQDKKKKKTSPDGAYDYYEDIWCLFTLLSTAAPKGGVPPCKVNESGVSREEYILSCFQTYGAFYRWLVAQRPDLEKHFCRYLKVSAEHLRVLSLAQPQTQQE